MWVREPACMNVCAKQVFTSTFFLPPRVHRTQLSETLNIEDFFPSIFIFVYMHTNFPVFAITLTKTRLQLSHSAMKMKASPLSPIKMYGWVSLSTSFPFPPLQNCSCVAPTVFHLLPATAAVALTCFFSSGCVWEVRKVALLLPQTTRRFWVMVSGWSWWEHITLKELNSGQQRGNFWMFHRSYKK